MTQLRVYLFGGVSLEYDNTPLPALPSLTARSLFAYCLRHAERSHTRPLLAGLFWPDLPESTARRRLSHALWEIRSTLEEIPVEQTYLRTDRTRVRFNPDASYWLDVERFEHLLDAETVTLQELREAVALYQDDFMAGFYDDWVLVERERLRDRYRDVLGRLVQRYKAHGQYEEALVFASELTHHDPLHENGHREVMRLCVVLGRLRKARQQYERCRDLLMDELGVEPSPATTALYEEIRTRSEQETSTIPRTSSASVSLLLEAERARSVPFVGRQAERASLVRTVEQTLAGTGGVVLVEGEAGIGKTRLLECVAEDAAWRGVQVLWGDGREAGRRSPYQAVQSALSDGLSPLRARQLAELVEGVWLRTASRLLPTLEDWLPDLPPRASLPPDQERRRLLEAITRLLLALAEIAPHLAVLDDVQWTDEGTLNILTHLAPRLADRRLLVVVAYRTEEARADQQVWSAIRELDRVAGRERLTLDRLDEEETAELVQRSLGGTEVTPQLTTQLYASSGGNPLFMLETLRMLYEEDLLHHEAGAWTTSPDETTGDLEGLPSAPALQTVIEGRLTRLRSASRAVLEAAAVIGDAIDLPVLLIASDRKRVDTLDAVETLIQRGLLVERDAAYTFSHDQIRRVAYDTLGEARRRRLHRRVAEALEAEHPEHVEALAEHFARGEVWDKAVEYAYRAAEAARSMYATQASLDNCDRALTILDTHTPFPPQREAELRYELLSIRRHLWRIKGDLSRQKADLDAMQRIARRLDDPLKMAEVHNYRAQFLYDRDQHESAYQQAAEALALAEQYDLTREAATALQSMGQSYYRRDRYEAAESYLQRSLEWWRQLTDTDLEVADVHVRLAQLYQRLRQFEQAESHTRTALALVEPSGDPYVLLQIYNLLGMIVTARGDHRAGIRYQTAGLEHARSVGFRFNEAVLLSNLGISYWALREYGRAIAYVRQGLDLYRRIENRRGIAISLENLGHLYREIGRHDQAEAALAEGIELARDLDLPYVRTLLLCDQGRLYLDRGAIDRARAKFEEARSVAQALDVPYVTGQLELCFGLLYLAEPNTASAARHFETALDAFAAGEEADWATLCRSYLARCRLEAGRHDEAVRLSTQAVRELEAQPGGEEPLTIYLHHWRIMRTVGRPQTAREVLETAYADLESHETTLPDPAWRHDFRTKVPAHREIVDAYAEWQAQRRTGQVTVRLPHIDAPTGRPLEDDEWVEVVWTVEAPADEAISGKKARRQQRIVRLLQEAEAQEAAPRVSDLAEALDVSTRTVKRDLAALRDTGRDVQTRGSR